MKSRSGVSYNAGVTHTRLRSATAGDFENAGNRGSIAFVSTSLPPFELTTWRGKAARLYAHEDDRRGDVEVNRA